MTFESSGSGTIGSVGQMDQETHKLKFDRDGIGGLIGLHIMNIIFMVLTLFIYRFWALTRVRRAIWPRMSLDGTPLEYTGTGLEIFLGFLKVFLLILLPYGLFSNWVQSHIINPELGLSPLFVALSLVSSLGIFFLYTAARYLAYRYRVNRTQWRGIRGSVGGAAYIYALKWIGYYFLAAITFGIMKPWADVKLLQYKLENTKFGGRSLSFEATTTGLWKPYLLIFAIYLVITVGATILGLNIAMEKAALGSELQPGDEAAMHWGIVSFILIGMIACALAYLNYLVVFWRQAVGKTSFGVIRFSFHPTRRQVVGLFLGNWLIIILTLGLLAPIAWLRKGTFLARHLTINGALDTDNLVQAEFDTDSKGEGLLGDFDIA